MADCRDNGARFSGLTSSWAPFLVTAATLLKPGGRMAFVVPAEIGHAPYAAPVIEYFVSRFDHVQIIAIREKFFPELSEDCWLLYADGFGGSTRSLLLTQWEEFRPVELPPGNSNAVDIEEWRGKWNLKLRSFLMPQNARELYQAYAGKRSSKRFGDVAAVGIGYVTGANDFFHLRPSEAEEKKIPHAFLHAAVRNGRALPSTRLTSNVVERWRRDDAPILLLKLPKEGELPRSVSRYLESDAGVEARQAYKCRVRDPWYSVPDVIVPDFFLSYMSSSRPSLVINSARCVGTNSVHAILDDNNIHVFGLQPP